MTLSFLLFSGCHGSQLLLHLIDLHYDDHLAFISGRDLLTGRDEFNLYVDGTLDRMLSLPLDDCLCV